MKYHDEYHEHRTKWRERLKLFVLFLCAGALVSGCAPTRHTREGILSQELPLTVDDLAEIRSGEENHQKVLAFYTVYENPALNAYLNLIASTIAEVSTRPHLPYHVVVLDSPEVNIFGGPGGFIYMTRGILDFVQSESEIAGLIAHEIGHISHRDYAQIPHESKIQLLYKGMLKGTELAKNSIGTYGSAAHYGVKFLGQAAPHISRRFGEDAEIVADDKGVSYLLKAGYDPRGFQKFVDRLSKIPMDDVVRFVEYLNTHPPFQSRRDVLNGAINRIDFESGSIEFKIDTLSEVRQMAVNTPEKIQPEVPVAEGSILFEPQFGLAQSNLEEMSLLTQSKSSKVQMSRRRPVLI